MKNNNLLQPLNIIHQSYAKTITKNAAIKCYDWIGKGDEKLADQAAVTAMRDTLNQLPISSRIVIGEGERDNAPMLYIGEKLGLGGDEVDIAVDPLEGTTLCAKAMSSAISVLALAPSGGLLNAPDAYMEKIAVGPNLPNKVVSLNNTLAQNITNLAKAKKCSPTELNICILDRARHAELIAKARECGPKIHLISDGDVSAVIATSNRLSNIDMYIGIGGAPEGVIAAAALSCSGGQMEGRLLFTEDEKVRAEKAGIVDFTRIYSISDMVKADVIFCATGVTSGPMLKGVVSNKSSITTYHLIMHRSQNLISSVKDIDNF